MTSTYRYLLLGLVSTIYTNYYASGFTNLKKSLLSVHNSVILQANIVDVAIENGNFKTLITAIEAAGLTSTLSGSGPFTVFAPNDEAFAKLPDGTLQSLLNDPPRLKQILQFHVVPRKMSPTRNGRNEDTLLISNSGYPKQLTIKIKNWECDTYIFTGQKNIPQVRTFDLPCDNGVIHEIDEVLVPYEEDFAPKISFIGEGDLSGKPSLQTGYYGIHEGKGRHGEVYDGPVNEKADIASFPIGKTWLVAGNWEYEPKPSDERRTWKFPSYKDKMKANK